MNRPTNLKELIAFLHDHPAVIMRGLKALPSRETFAGMDGGFMLFTSEDGQRHNLPINCGMVAHETGVTFDQDGFHVTKFGHTLHYLYADDSPAPAELEKQLAYLKMRFEDLSARVAHDDTKFEALTARLERLETAVAVILNGRRRRDLKRDTKLEADRGDPPLPKPPLDPRD